MKLAAWHRSPQRRARCSLSILGRLTNAVLGALVISVYFGSFSFEYVSGIGPIADRRGPPANFRALAADSAQNTNGLNGERKANLHSVKVAGPVRKGKQTLENPSIDEIEAHKDKGALLTNNLLSRFIVVPEHKLLFCYIEKVRINKLQLHVHFFGGVGHIR